MIFNPKKELLLELKLTHLDMWKILLEAQKNKPEDWREVWLLWFEKQHKELEALIKTL